jgi:hypothetical protein
MKTGVHIGHSKGSVKKQRKMIMSIVGSPAADDVKLAAIDALSRTFEIRNVTLENVSINTSGKAEGSSPYRSEYRGDYSEKSGEAETGPSTEKPAATDPLAGFEEFD